MVFRIPIFVQCTIQLDLFSASLDLKLLLVKQCFSRDAMVFSRFSIKVKSLFPQKYVSK